MSDKKTKQFDAQVDKVLSIMINSLYSEKDIFLRELISNASDACDKLRWLSMTNHALIDEELKILVSVDKEARKIVIEDNGIGMNISDLEENLGTIARSGTQKFIEQIGKEGSKANDLIGNFGVGFYSAFMVAENVCVISKKAGEENVYEWESSGNAEYTISLSEEKIKQGTRIILTIKENEDDFLDHFRLKNIIKKYSDHIAFPIYFKDATNTQEIKVNSGSALWTRDRSEITDEQYQEFYRSVSYAADKPFITLHHKHEGIFFTSLLFIPEAKPYDLLHPDRQSRVKLYIKRVFISESIQGLIPKYLRFVRGIVDCEDLPLNISRETLQNNPTIDKIRSTIVKKIIGALRKKQTDEHDAYLKFWSNFGLVIKEGLCEYSSDHDDLLSICLFKSALHNKMITIDEYIANIKDAEKVIYYISGDSESKLLKSPQIEGLLSNGTDVLLFTDNVDDFWVSVVNNYKEHELKSATRESVGDTTAKNSTESLNEDEISKLCEYFKQYLGDRVEKIIPSKKLTLSPVCLSTTDNGMDIRMQRFLRDQNQLNKTMPKILEINSSHKIIKNIYNNISNGIDQNNLIEVLFVKACILEGEEIDDLDKFSKTIDSLLEKGL